MSKYMLVEKEVDSLREDNIQIADNRPVLQAEF